MDAEKPYQCSLQVPMRDVDEYHAAFHKNKEKLGRVTFTLPHADFGEPDWRRKLSQIPRKPILYRAVHYENK